MHRFTIIMAALLVIPVCPGELAKIDYHIQIQPQPKEGIYQLKSGEVITFKALGLSIDKDNRAIISNNIKIEEINWQYDKFILEKVDSGKDFIKLKTIQIGLTELSVSGVIQNRLGSDTIAIEVLE